MRDPHPELSHYKCKAHLQPGEFVPRTPHMYDNGKKPKFHRYDGSNAGPNGSPWDDRVNTVGNVRSQEY